jgi:hypothetical protein
MPRVFSVAIVTSSPDTRLTLTTAAMRPLAEAVKQAKTTRLLNGQEWVESLRKAQGSGYQPAR